VTGGVYGAAVPGVDGAVDPTVVVVVEPTVSVDVLDKVVTPALSREELGIVGGAPIVATGAAFGGGGGAAWGGGNVTSGGIAKGGGVLLEAEALLGDVADDTWFSAFGDAEPVRAGVCLRSGTTLETCTGFGW
jgi:hypothetical protein